RAHRLRRAVDLILEGAGAAAAAVAGDRVDQAAADAAPGPEQHEAAAEQDREAHVRDLHHALAFAFEVEQHRKTSVSRPPGRSLLGRWRSELSGYSIARTGLPR